MLSITFIFYGFTVTIGQLLLLRELHVVFPANEYTISFGLATWLFSVGAGSGWSGRLIPALKTASPRVPYALISILTALSIPVSIIIARSLKQVFGIGFGELAGPVTIFWGILLTTVPAGFTAGAQFVSATSLMPGRKVYFWESIGAFAGGLTFTFFLVEMVPMNIACALFFLNMGISLLLFTDTGTLRLLRGACTELAECARNDGRKARNDRTCILASCMLIVLAGFASNSELLDKFDFNLRKWEWRSYHLLSETNTRFGHLAVTGTGALYSLFEDGIIAATWPLPEYTEELVHISLLVCPKVERVLLIGGSYKGTIAEILKHNPKSVHVVEPNKRLKPFLEPYLDSGTLASFKDARVHYHYADGRLWHTGKTNAYDAIILDLPPPITSTANRFYTVEFFETVKAALKPDGILAFKLPATENYINPELQMFNAVIYQSLRHTFPNAIALPGLNTLFLCSDSEAPLSLEDVKLTAIYKDRRLKNRLVVPVYFPFKLNKERVEYLKARLEIPVVELNSDYKPVSYTLWYKFWKKEFSSPFYVINYAGAVFLLIWFVCKLVKSPSPPPSPTRGEGDMDAPTPSPLGEGIQKSFPLPWGEGRVSGSIFLFLVMGIIGFTGILFELTVIMIYQTRFGYVYEQLGLIFALFMVGLAFGSGMILAFKNKYYRILLFVSCIGMSAICAVGSLMFVSSPRLGLFISLIFAGIVTGMAYPVICVIGDKFHVPASSVYQADLIGSGTGAIISLVTITQLGIMGTVKMLAIISCATVLLCYGATVNDDDF